MSAKLQLLLWCAKGCSIQDDFDGEEHIRYTHSFGLSSLLAPFFLQAHVYTRRPLFCRVTVQTWLCPP